MYQEFKYLISDSVCAGLSPLSGDLFGKACPRFIDGFLVTIELLVLACGIGFFLAIGLTLARMSGRRPLAWPATALVYVFRGTPLLVQLWIIYFGFGSLGEDILGPILWSFFKNPWLVGLLVLTLNTSAYVSEIFRGGLANVDRGQLEAALSIGMPWLRAMRRIMLPQAIRIAWPAYGNELVLMMKGSALISTITVLDLMGQTRTVFARNFDLTTYLYAAILYLVLAGLITAFVNTIERRMQLSAGR
ncbi:ABC transporter permease subunit [uncultured Tateyamaria sp.]|uniref:ABC transporter permease n=1 Tax=uncultured Tateyamaria sp. TaxID=455651 RepID=UPI002608ED6E|nr:ABC transporter permease subunit [uncultured Tateyamaria sp.]